MPILLFASLLLVAASVLVAGIRGRRKPNLLLIAVGLNVTALLTILLTAESSVLGFIAAPVTGAVVVVCILAAGRDAVRSFRMELVLAAVTIVGMFTLMLAERAPYSVRVGGGAILGLLGGTLLVRLLLRVIALRSLGQGARAER